MVTGILLSLLGIVLLLSPAAVGGAVVRVVALVLIVVGVLQALQAFRGGTPAHNITSLVLGAVIAGLGVLVWLNPELGTGFLTALLMIFFIVNGLWKIATALRFRNFRGWLWLLLSGAVSLVFVYLLWSQWPVSGAWVIGVLVGLDLLLTGIALLLLSLALRKARSSDYLGTIQL